MVLSNVGRKILPLFAPYSIYNSRGTRGHAIPLSPDGITPYLGLQARLSQIWVNRWTVLLLLILARILIAISSLDSEVTSARREVLSSCSSVESASSAMVSMPHYMAHGVNEITSTGVEEAVKGLESMLLLTATGVEEIVLYLIRVMYSTYLCLVTLAVRGSVHVATELLADAGDFVNKTVKSIGNDISYTTGSFDHNLNDFLGKLNGAASVSGRKVPSINLTDQINQLQGIPLPASIGDDIVSLNESLPNLIPSENVTQNTLSTPFEEVKRNISQALGNYSFNRSALPVPKKNQLSFCEEGNNGINGLFDDVSGTIATGKKTAIAVFVLIAIFICIPLAWNEIHRWRLMKKRSQLVHKEAHDPMDVVYMVSRPYTAGTGVKAASGFSDARKQILIRWTTAYATTTRALFVLFLGIAGLVSCLCQYIILQNVQHAVPEETRQHASHLSNQQVLSSLENTSTEWAKDANAVIGHISNEMNNQVFGLVNTSTAALNDTLNSFVDMTTNILNATFSGTSLHESFNAVFDGLNLLKVKGIESGLTWAHQNVHINFPLLPNDTFSRGISLSSAQQHQNSYSYSSSSSLSYRSFTSNNDDSTTTTTASDQITSKINHLLDERIITKFKNSIQTEAIIAFVLVLVWLAVANFGIFRALALYFRRGKTRAEGGGPPLILDPTRADNGCSTTTTSYKVDDANHSSTTTLVDIPLATFQRDRHGQNRGGDCVGDADFSQSEAAPRYEIATRSSFVPLPGMRS